MSHLFYLAKQGRLVSKGHGVMDDATSLHLNLAIVSSIATYGPRMVFKGACARKDAEHGSNTVLSV
ncbi:MAG: hypothetical protein QGI78_02355 [Phycisphaerales bacterium]|nr:hypothetical protein [Phycisphaerales bacterium]